MARAVTVAPASAPTPTSVAPTVAGRSGADSSTSAGGDEVRAGGSTDTTAPPDARSSVSTAIHATQNNSQRATSWIHTSTARMPANGPAVGLPADFAIVYVPRIFSSSNPIEAIS